MGKAFVHCLLRDHLLGSYNMITANQSSEVHLIYGHFTDGTDKGREAKAERVPAQPPAFPLFPRTSDAYAEFVFLPPFNGTQPPKGTCCS